MIFFQDALEDGEVMIVASLALVGLLAQIVLTSATVITRQPATQSMEDASASRDLQEQGKKYNYDNSS
jgi:hypothetical protein